MSLSSLFSSRRSSSHEPNPRASKDMLTRGREIVRGRLLMRKGSSKKSLTEVVVYCAPHDCSQPGQLEIFEEVNKTYQKPKKIISLTDITQPGIQSGSPCTSLSSSPGNYTFGTSPSSNGVPLFPFQLVLRAGDVFEFFAESPEDQRQWVKRLSLLLMFPYSPIPDEPVNPIKESIRAKLNPADYNADSIWVVYILPEEVGSRINALGLHVVALKSRGPQNQTGQLDIINLADRHTPVVTWDRDKMRRTGCLGNMVFIEIGRRCQGGAGLVWMYAGPKETAALRETLHAFLFKGDGRAVPISTQQQPNMRTDNNNRVSFDSGVPSSYPKQGSSSYHRSPSISTPQRQQSIDSQASDSGLPPSYPKQSSSSSIYPHQHSPTPHRQLSIDSQGGGDHSSSPRNNPPPPVHLSTHPSRRQSFRSNSVNYENVDTDSGISSGTSGYTNSRRSSTMSEMTDGEQFQLEDAEGEFLSNRHDSSDTNTTTNVRHTTFSSSHYQVPQPVSRSHTVSGSRPYQHAEQYEKMINPRNSHMMYSQEDQYVQMKPALTKTNSFRSSSDSPPKPLHPIVEGAILTNSRDHRISRNELSNYENLSFQATVKPSDFEYYTPNYENIDHMRDTQRRHSFSRDGKHVKSISPSGNHNVRTVETPTQTPSPPVIISTPPLGM